MRIRAVLVISILVFNGCELLVSSSPTPDASQTSPDAGAEGAVEVRGGITTGGSAATGNYRVREGGLEYQGRACAASRCVSGGITP